MDIKAAANNKDFGATKHGQRLLRRALGAILSVALLLLPLTRSAADQLPVLADTVYKLNTGVTNRHFDTPEEAFAAYQAWLAGGINVTVDNLTVCTASDVEADGAYLDRVNGKHQSYCWTVHHASGNTGRLNGISAEQLCPIEKPNGNYFHRSGSPAPNYRDVILYCTGGSRREPNAPDGCSHECGNPIAVETRTKVQREIDVADAGLLGFTRTYTSSAGEWRHTFSERTGNLDFNRIDIVGQAGPQGCFSGIANRREGIRRICLPYVSPYDLGGRTGAGDWILHRADGRTVLFDASAGRSLNIQANERAQRLNDGSGNFNGLLVYKDDTREEFDIQGRLVSRQWIDGRSVVLTYLDPTGAKSPASAPSCNLVTTGPATPGNPSCVTEVHTGRQLAFIYDTNGLLTALKDPAGQTISYGYNGPSAEGSVPLISRLTSVTYPDSHSRVYHYNEAARTGGASHVWALTGITGEDSSRYAYFSYNYDGEAVSTASAGGVNSYTVSSSTVTDALGTQRLYQTTSFARAASDGVIVTRAWLPYRQTKPSVTGSGTVRQQLDRDSAGNVYKTTGYRGEITQTTFDLTRNLPTQSTEAFGTPRARTISTAWHPDWRLKVRTAEPFKSTWWVYNGQPDPSAGGAIASCAPSAATIDGKPIAVLCKKIEQATTDTNGAAGFSAVLIGSSRVVSYTYNEFGQVLTVDGPRTDVTDVTTYTYYACNTGVECGQLHTITNALGHVTTYSSYNAYGRPLTITDSNGVITTLTYDSRQRLTSRTVGADVATWEYWPTGLLKKTTLPDGSYLEYVYDAAHRLTDVSDAEGNRVHYTLDLMSNRTGEQVYDPSNALTRTRTQAFNALSQLQQQIGAAGTAGVTTTYGYDNNGNQTSIVAPLGRDTSQTYDELDRLTSVTDPLNGLTRYGYNALSQLISVTDPRGLVTSYDYSGLGELKQQTSPDAGVTSNTYDSGGNLATSIDARGAVATYTYDALNRVATTSFSVGGVTDQAFTYTYDAGTYGNGRLSGVSDGNHSLSWTYDEQGRLLTAAQANGSISKTTSYTYANGLRQSMTTPSGQVITYGYTNGRVTSISVNGTTVISDVLYDPFGPARQWTWADGSLAVRTFDQDGKITQIDSAGLKTYGYDDAFRITGITDTSSSALSWTYGYDDLDRLTSASNAGTTLGYTYDANGNRLTETGSNPSTFTVAANSNRLSSTSGALARTYGYDAAGNTTSFNGISFTYNNRGRMSSSTKSGVTTSYIYNAIGQLIQQGTSTHYYYDDAGHILGIYDGSGALKGEIVWLGDTPIATLRPQSGGGVSIYNIHADHLNAPRIVTDSVSGAVRWRWDGEPFGGGTVNDNPSGVGAFEFNLRFPGQIAMAQTGLYYNYYRDYDPSTGRYVQSDPIGLKGGINTYSYAGSNPGMGTDPLGLFLCGDWKWMAFDWATGLGSRNRRYGPFSDQVGEVAKLPPIQEAKELYRSKNQKELSSECCNPSNLEPYTEHRGTFGVSGFAQATMMGSCAWHFIGSMAVNVYPITCNKVRLVVTNNSSFTSFAYGLWPSAWSWSQGPGGSMHQTYEWEESL